MRVARGELLYPDGGFRPILATRLSAVIPELAAHERQLSANGEVRYTPIPAAQTAAFEVSLSSASDPKRSFIKLRGILVYLVVAYTAVSNSALT